MTVAYRLLDGAFGKSGERLRSDYVAYTWDLLARIQADGADVLVFLDRSARPVWWLVNALGPVLGLDSARPRVCFSFIDRLAWRPLTGSLEGPGGLRLDALPKADTDRLRAIFHGRGGKTLDGARILVVDEVRASGDTLAIAIGLFERAFPTAEVSGAWWMRPPAAKAQGGTPRIAEVPVWYSDQYTGGRGVSTPRNQRSFLALRPEQPDVRAIQLRREIAQLALDVAQGRQRIRPPVGVQLTEQQLTLIRRSQQHPDPRARR